ncbi:MAG: FAD-dependent oxidoreductase [Planctomycetes bacterium]|nr:FAD-dependent oxidoreductase [Planctomycetota bacterium]
MNAELLDSVGGHSLLLLGNEAIVRGAIEARLGFAASYPGTPASEVGETLERLQAGGGPRLEWSINEKIAVESAFGASLAGVRSLAAMKHLGLAYAGDPLSTIPCIGVVGGLVVVSAADPGCRNSPNEHDQRHFARMVGMPTLEPSSPDEARSMARFAFDLSEKSELPVLLRVTARVAHTRGPVRTEAFAPPRPPARFVRRPERFLPVPVNARRLRVRLDERIEIARRLLETCDFCPRFGPPAGRRGIVSAGAPAEAVRELLETLDVAAATPLLRLGALHPLPEQAVADFLLPLEEVLVVEELSPFLEEVLLALAKSRGLAVRVLGKRTGHVPGPHEMDHAALAPALRHFLRLASDRSPLAPAPAGVEEPCPPNAPAAVDEPPAARVAAVSAAPLTPPARPPTLCPGCPHTATFLGLKLVFGDESVIVNDIGCYTLGIQAPHRAGDALLCMGASLPLAASLARVTNRRTVAVMGDSTFFHSGLPALADAVEHQADVVLVVMDNQATAMTGHQLSPSSPQDRGGRARPRRSIAGCAAALGVEGVERVDPFDFAALTAVLHRARAAAGPRVVVAERACPYFLTPAGGPLEANRAGAGAGSGGRAVDAQKCGSCGMAEAGLFCGLPPSAAVDRLSVRQRIAGRALCQRAFPAGPPAVAPCAAACPVGICVQAYVGAVAAGQPEAGLRAVVDRAALPSICSHVCHRPCEAECVLAPPPVDGDMASEAGRPVAVNEIKRHLTEAAGLAISHPECPPPAPGAPTVAVVGAGPAGLAAARELRRCGHAVTLYDAADAPGGALRLIPEYRLPRAALDRDLEALLALGIDYRPGRRLGRDFSVADLRRSGHPAILLALGAGRVHRPPIPGSENPEVSDALAFLRDGHGPVAGRVVVIGGGDVAVDVARTAVRRGAKAALIALEARDALPADPATVAAAEREGVEVLVARGVAEIAFARAAGGGLRLRTAAVRRIAVGSRGELLPELGAAEDDVVADRVVLATGLEPDADAMNLPDLPRRPGGWVEADPYGRTAVGDLFVAGDITLGPSNATRAMASGVRAAFAIDLALRPSLAAPCRAPLDLPPRQRDVGACSPWVMAESVRLAKGGDGASCLAPPPPMDADQARAEAGRCLLCARCARCDACAQVVGCPAFGPRERLGRVIDPLRCIACDVCATLCPNQAIVPAEATC